MLIDCDSCTVRGAACAGCAVTALLTVPPHIARLTPTEHRAIETFARAGFQVDVLPPPRPGPVRLARRSRPRRRPAA